MSDSNKIAVIGYAMSLPGCPDAEALWQMTSQKREGIKHYQKDEFRAHVSESFFQSPAFRAVGGGPEDYRCFDASFFGYNPKEASYLDPQIRKSLEYAWLACENAGYAPDRLDVPVGVYGVSAVNSYFNENLANLFHREVDTHEQTQILYLNEADFLASRIAYHFNWHGIAVNLRSGCSSSLVAVHEACKGLLHFDIDIALVGGAVIKPRNHYGYHYEQGGIQSNTGHCAPFSDSANGTVFTNGVAFLVLKRYDEALEAGDNIHAVVLASAVNNDGSDKVGYMAPSVSGQVKVMLNALASAEIEPEDVSYIEAHGTGTQLGDPIEFEGLMKVYGGLPAESIALSTVKANIGHLDALSGLVGVLKVIQDLKHQSISPLANFNKPNPAIDVERSPFIIPQNLLEWKTSAEQRRIAAVSSFGVGGTNAVLILEQAPLEPVFTSDFSGTCFVGISARTTEALSQQIKDLISWIKLHPDSNLRDIAWTLLAGRSAFRYRWGCWVTSIDELYEKLSSATTTDFVTVHASQRWSLEDVLVTNVEKLGSFWLNGGEIDIKGMLPVGCKRISLPGYPFHRQEYWIEQDSLRQMTDEQDVEKIQDISQWFYTPIWKKQRIPTTLPDLTNKILLVFDYQSTFSIYFSAKLRELGAKVLHVSAGSEYCRLAEDRYQITPGDEQQMQMLVKTLREVDQLPDWIVHLWCLENANETYKQIQDKGIYTMVALCKAYNQLTLTVNFHSMLVTNRMASITGQEEIEPIKSTLLGISQVLPKEYQNIKCHLVDIVPEFQPKQTIQLLLAEMVNSVSSEIAIRGVHRFVKDYERYRLPADRLCTSLLQGNKTILIVGGLGNFGLELTEFIAVNYQAHVYLTTRTHFPKREEWAFWLKQYGDDNTISQKIRRLQHIEALQGKVDILTADVTSRSDMERIKNLCHEKNGRIDGVIHAAGTVDSGMIHTKTRESLEQVFAAKIDGIVNLCDVFLPLNPDIVLLCSSMNAIIGGLGQIDNTAANAFVDAWSESCHQRGFTQVLAINWGAVNEARARNYSALPQFKELSKEHVKNKMTQEEIFEVYRRLFSSSFGSRVVVSTLDFNKVIENWWRVGSVEALTKKVTINVGKREEFVHTVWSEPITPYEVRIAEHWQSLLGIERVGNDDNFFELGGNSLIVLQLIGLLKEDYPIRMHAMTIYEHPTVREFASYVEQLVCEIVDKSRIPDRYALSEGLDQ